MCVAADAAGDAKSDANKLDSNGFINDLNVLSSDYVDQDGLDATTAVDSDEQKLDIGQNDGRIDKLVSGQPQIVSAADSQPEPGSPAPTLSSDYSKSGACRPSLLLIY